MSTFLDLDAPGVRKALARQILDDIDEYCRVTYDDGHRHHLGASEIGHGCERYLWSVFRWLKKTNFDGRMQRLFNRGHREEARFIEWLRGIGFTVWEVDDNGNQHRVKACRGHFGGSLDGINRPPERYRLNEPLLCEFKTKGTGSGFVNLCKNGVAIEQPKHYRQMCIYGKNYGFRNALYLSINKNDDAIHVEIVKLDWALADSLEAKADSIIRSTFPPAKISDSPAYYECKNCTFHGLCHENKPPDKNCRSCRAAIPIEDGQWHCELFKNTIPKDFLIKGCNHWSSIA